MMADGREYGFSVMVRCHKGKEERSDSCVAGTIAESRGHTKVMEFTTGV